MVSCARTILTLDKDSALLSQQLDNLAATISRTGCFDAAVCAMRASPRLLAASTLNDPMRRVIVVAAARSTDAALSAAIGERQPKRSAKNLSARELEVLHLVAEGFHNDGIAKRLFISPKTVKTHLQNIYKKLDVKSRTEAAVKAKELGLLG